MAWAEWMIVEPTLEQELKLESESRAILEDDNHEEIAKLCAALSKQTWYQQRLIDQTVKRVAELEAMLICQEIRNERPWWRRIKNPFAVF